MTKPEPLRQSPSVVVSCPHGDAGAPLQLDAIYRDELDYVWRVARRLVGDSADLEDLVHDVFMVVQRKLPDYDPSRPIKPWLFGITYRVVLAARRRRRREVVSSELARPVVGPTQLEAVEAAAARDLLARAMQALSIDERAVFVMYDIDEHAVADIARELSIPDNTVYSRLRRARRKLKRAVARLQKRGSRGE